VNHSEFFLRADNIYHHRISPPTDHSSPWRTSRWPVPGTLASSGEQVAMQLPAHLWPTGRILDNFHLAFGADILKADLDIGCLISSATFKGYKLNYCISIGPDTSLSGVSGAWMDMPATVAANNAVVPSGAGLPSSEFSRILEHLPNDGPKTCAITWAVVVEKDTGPKLKLQALPSDAACLNSRP
jgi:hypothetical protein